MSFACCSFDRDQESRIALRSGGFDLCEGQGPIRKLNESGMSASADPMTDTGDDLGTIRRVEGGFEAHLVRDLDHDTHRVWEMLVESEKLIQWLAPGSIELRLGGAAKLNFADSGIVIDSKVSAFQPGRLIEYSWSGPGEPERPLRWEVSPAGEQARLTLTLRVPNNEDVARSCAGWEAHLMMLIAALEGVPIKFPFERFKSTREAYKLML